MFTVKRYTNDPTLSDVHELYSRGDLFTRQNAEALARCLSRTSFDYCAVYADDGVQLAGYVNDKCVYQY